MSREIDEYKILGALVNFPDATNESIADELEVSLSTVTRMRTKLKKAKENDTVDELIATVPLGLADDLIAKHNQTLATEVQPAMKDMITGAEGLTRLDLDLQASAREINKKLMIMIHMVDRPGELLDLTDVLCKLRDSFFNTKNPQVNVQNNYGGGESDGGIYTEWLGDNSSAIRSDIQGN